MYSIIDFVKYNMSILMTWAYIFFSQKKNRTILMRKKDTDFSRSDYIFKSRQLFLQGHKKSHLFGLAFLCPTLPKKPIFWHLLFSTYFKEKWTNCKKLLKIFLPNFDFLNRSNTLFKNRIRKKKQYFSHWGELGTYACTMSVFGKNSYQHCSH